jgi:DNA helicase-4
VAKAGYILSEGLAEADQIVMLAFNVATAKELGERVAQRLKGVPGVEGISSQTFHAFGLTVIGAATGKKPRLAPWVDQGQEGQVMTDIAKQLIATDRAFARDWDMFRTIYAREKKTGGASDPDGYKNGRRGLATASGDVVKRLTPYWAAVGAQSPARRLWRSLTALEMKSAGCVLTGLL